MRSYVVLFDPNHADEIRKRVYKLRETVGLPTELVYEEIDSTNGKTFGIYVAEETANRFPAFVSEFPVGEWQDRP